MHMRRNPVKRRKAFFSTSGQDLRRPPWLLTLVVVVRRSVSIFFVLSCLLIAHLVVLSSTIAVTGGGSGNALFPHICSTLNLPPYVSSEVSEGSPLGYHGERRPHHNGVAAGKSSTRDRRGPTHFAAHPQTVLQVVQGGPLRYHGKKPPRHNLVAAGKPSICRAPQFAAFPPSLLEVFQGGPQRSYRKRPSRHNVDAAGKPSTCKAPQFAAYSRSLLKLFQGGLLRYHREGPPRHNVVAAGKPSTCKAPRFAAFPPSLLQVFQGGRQRYHLERPLHHDVVKAGDFFTHRLAYLGKTIAHDTQALRLLPKQGPYIVNNGQVDCTSWLQLASWLLQGQQVVQQQQQQQKCGRQPQRHRPGKLRGGRHPHQYRRQPHQCRQQPHQCRQQPHQCRQQPQQCVQQPQQCGQQPQQCGHQPRQCRQQRRCVTFLCLDGRVWTTMTADDTCGSFSSRAASDYVPGTLLKPPSCFLIARTGVTYAPRDKRGMSEISSYQQERFSRYSCTLPAHQGLRSGPHSSSSEGPTEQPAEGRAAKRLYSVGSPAVNLKRPNAWGSVVSTRQLQCAVQTSTESHHGGAEQLKHSLNPQGNGVPSLSSVDCVWTARSTEGEDCGTEKGGNNKNTTTEDALPVTAGVSDCVWTAFSTEGGSRVAEKDEKSNKTTTEEASPVTAAVWDVKGSSEGDNSTTKDAAPSVTGAVPAVKESPASSPSPRANEGLSENRETTPAKDALPSSAAASDAEGSSKGQNTTKEDAASVTAVVSNVEKATTQDAPPVRAVASKAEKATTQDAPPVTAVGPNVKESPPSILRAREDGEVSSSLSRNIEGEAQQRRDGVAQEAELVAEGPFPFPRLGLFPNFVEALSHMSIRGATEIQQLGLPAIFSGADVVLGAETGSGKTLGYILGILQNVLLQKIIHERKEDEAMVKRESLPVPRHYPYAVVVVPTRELALQVAGWSRRLCRKTAITAQLLLGSYTLWPFGTLTIPTSPDVIICTPQVLAGFTRSGGYKKKIFLFEQTQMLVVDEADMLLDGGYKKLMESVFLEFRKSDKLKAADGKRRTQYIFAAATIPERGPASIRRTISALCPGASFLCTNSLHHQRKELQQEFIEIPADASFGDRTNLLLEQLRTIPSTERVMIFCNTAQTAKQVLEALEKALPSAANPKLFSSDLDQKDRARNLGFFAREKAKVLVCTDAASRGLDIMGVTNVIQFDFALNAVTHLHRIGRVARAGNVGKAINFYEPASKALVDAVRYAAHDPTRRSLADAFSRRRSFRKSLKKAESKSVGLVVEFSAPPLGAEEGEVRV